MTRWLKVQNPANPADLERMAVYIRAVVQAGQRFLDSGSAACVADVLGPVSALGLVADGLEAALDPFDPERLAAARLTQPLPKVPLRALVPELQRSLAEENA